MILERSVGNKLHCKIYPLHSSAMPENFIGAAMGLDVVVVVLDVADDGGAGLVSCC